jgi:hypothetical protein
MIYAGISPRDKWGRFFALVVRTRSYCPDTGSLWNNFNYSVLRPSNLPLSPKFIFQGNHGHWENNDFRIALESDGFTMQFPDNSRTASITRPHVLKYRVTAGRVRRIGPIAVDAFGFVEEWLTVDWSEASRWSNPGIRALHVWHKRLHSPGAAADLFGDIPFRQYCSPDRKQIQISFPQRYPVSGPRPGDVFFQLQEIGSNQFQMINIGTQPLPNCTEPEAGPDEAAAVLPSSANRRPAKLVP